eukprot:c53297_g1_i1 orf=510-1244(+)
MRVFVVCTATVCSICIHCDRQPNILNMAAYSHWVCVFWVALISIGAVVGSDPDPLQDFCVAETSVSFFSNGLPCKNPAKVTSADFKSSILSTPGNTSNALGLAVTLAAGSTFPGLNTQGISVARIDLAKGGLVPPHVHPRASEVIFVVKGAQLVGFVDTNNNLFSKTIYAGELFVFPRGLVHYQLSVADGPGFSISSLNSQNPGLSLVATALFGSNPPIPNIVLEKTLHLTEKQVTNIKQAFHS